MPRVGEALLEPTDEERKVLRDRLLDIGLRTVASLASVLRDLGIERVRFIEYFDGYNTEVLYGGTWVTPVDEILRICDILHDVLTELTSLDLVKPSRREDGVEVYELRISDVHVLTIEVMDIRDYEKLMQRLRESL